MAERWAFPARTHARFLNGGIARMCVCACVCTGVASDDEWWTCLSNLLLPCNVDTTRPAERGEVAVSSLGRTGVESATKTDVRDKRVDLDPWQAQQHVPLAFHVGQDVAFSRFLGPEESRTLSRHFRVRSIVATAESPHGGDNAVVHRGVARTARLLHLGAAGSHDGDAAGRLPSPLPAGECVVYRQRRTDTMRLHERVALTAFHVDKTEDEWAATASPQEDERWAELFTEREPTADDAVLGASGATTHTLREELFQLFAVVRKLFFAARVPVPWLLADQVHTRFAEIKEEVFGAGILGNLERDFVMPLAVEKQFRGNRRGTRHTPRGVLLYGPPGTAKTTLATKFAFGCGFRVLMSGTAAELNRPLVGQAEEAIQQLAEFAMKQPDRPTVLVIDEVETLARSRSSGGSSGGGGGGGNTKGDILNVLLGFIGGAADVPNLFIIGCTNFKNAIDAAFLRSGRIELHYFLGKLKSTDRVMLIARELLEWCAPAVAALAGGNRWTTRAVTDRISTLTPSVNLLLQELVELTTFMSGAEIKSALYAARRCVLHRAASRLGRAGVDAAPSDLDGWLRMLVGSNRVGLVDDADAKCRFVFHRDEQLLRKQWHFALAPESHAARGLYPLDPASTACDPSASTLWTAGTMRHAGVVLVDTSTQIATHFVHRFKAATIAAGAGAGAGGGTGAGAGARPALRGAVAPGATLYGSDDTLQLVLRSPCRWMVEGDSRTEAWKDMDAAAVRKILVAVQLRRPYVHYTVGTNGYVLDLLTLVQTNTMTLSGRGVGTGVRRAVRVLRPDPTETVLGQGQPQVHPVVAVDGTAACALGEPAVLTSVYQLHVPFRSPEEVAARIRFPGTRQGVEFVFHAGGDFARDVVSKGTVDAFESLEVCLSTLSLLCCCSRSRQLPQPCARRCSPLLRLMWRACVLYARVLCSQALMSEFRQYGQQGIRCCLVVDVDAIAGVVTESNVQRSSALSSSIQATGQVGGGIPFLSGSKSWMSSYTTPSLTESHSQSLRLSRCDGLAMLRESVEQCALDALHWTKAHPNESARQSLVMMSSSTDVLDVLRSTLPVAPDMTCTSELVPGSVVILSCAPAMCLGVATGALCTVSESDPSAQWVLWGFVPRSAAKPHERWVVLRQFLQPMVIPPVDDAESQSAPFPAVVRPQSVPGADASYLLMDFCTTGPLRSGDVVSIRSVSLKTSGAKTIESVLSLYSDPCSKDARMQWSDKETPFVVLRRRTGLAHGQ